MIQPDGGILRGTLDVLILKALTWEPLHGYAIVDWIVRATESTVLLDEGTIYPALHRLHKKGWITAEWGLSDNNRRAKFYALTRLGRTQLRTETSMWEQYAVAVTKALRVTRALTR
ncbi:MAG TPA: PadR family transcriptional regulator [Gemmatimonadaceae bacterium]|jgi:transcriptional regulator